MVLGQIPDQELLQRGYVSVGKSMVKDNVCFQSEEWCTYTSLLETQSVCCRSLECVTQFCNLASVCSDTRQLPSPTLTKPMTPHLSPITNSQMVHFRGLSWMCVDTGFVHRTPDVVSAWCWLLFVQQGGGVGAMGLSPLWAWGTCCRPGPQPHLSSPPLQSLSPGHPYHSMVLHTFYDTVTKSTLWIVVEYVFFHLFIGPWNVVGAGHVHRRAAGALWRAVVERGGLQGMVGSWGLAIVVEG